MSNKRVVRTVTPWLLLAPLALCGACSDAAGEGGDTSESESSASSGESEGADSGEVGGEAGEATGPTTGDGDATGDGDGDSAGDGDGDGTTTGDGDGDGTATGDGDGDTSGDGDGDGSPGCGLALSSGTSDMSVSVGGAQRTYILSVPDNYDPDRAYPLVFAWHGRGGDGALARLYFGIEGASNDNAIFVYPDGLPQATGGGETGWDLGINSPDIQLFDEILSEVRSSACVDESRVFSTGHSFGAYISNALACQRGATLRAIAGAAGGPSFTACDDGQVAAWLAHDPSDSVVQYSQGTQARDQYLARNSCASTSNAVSPFPCESYVGCDAGASVIWCSHDDGGGNGHDWPDFAATGIWNFFDAQ